MTFPSLVPGQSSEKVTSSRGSLLPGTVRIPRFFESIELTIVLYRLVFNFPFISIRCLTSIINFVNVRSRFVGASHVGSNSCARLKHFRALT